MMNKNHHHKSRVLLALVLMFSLVLGSVPAWAEPTADTPTATEMNEIAPENTTDEVVTEPEENNSENTAEEVTEPSEGLEVGEEVVPPAVQQGDVVEISSFEDLKPYLEYKDITIDNLYQFERLVLKGGNYELTNDFIIDLSDSFFAGKEDAIQYGVISANESFAMNGNGHTISFKQDDAVALFGIIDVPTYTIENMTISYPNNVAGFGFAQMLRSEDVEKGLAEADGAVKNITVNVGGNVTPLKTNAKEQASNHFVGSFEGVLSTGFAWYIDCTNLDDIVINVAGNIGSADRPADGADMTGAYGFTFHFTNVPYTPTFNSETWNELHVKDNPTVLKNIGHIIGLDINVGGNIQAYGHNLGYAAGLGNDMAGAWIENAHLDIAGDIILDLEGNNSPLPSDVAVRYAYGLSEELMNFTDSSLSVRNIVVNAPNVPKDEPILIGATAYYNNHGNYINLQNNVINVQGAIKGISNQSFISTIGFRNHWNSLSKNGVNWLQYSENNTYNVGAIDLKSDQEIAFVALGSKWRTGDRRDDVNNPSLLPSVSQKNNKVTCGDVNIQAGARATVALMMDNASNAKNNTLDYGNINIKAQKTSFNGMGYLQSAKPTTNFYENIAENNHITFKDLTIDTDEMDLSAVMAGWQDKEQKIKNCSVTGGNVDIKLNPQNRPVWLGGIAAYSQDDIDGARVAVTSFNMENTGTQGLYFGLGVADKRSSQITNSGALVSGDLTVNATNDIPIYGGGFIGIAYNSLIEGNNLQIVGKNNINFRSNTFYGGFAGWPKDDSTLKNNSSLLLSDYLPCVYYADGVTIERQAHYINEQPFKYHTGFFASGRNNPKIINSTLLVPQEAEEAILYPVDLVSADSKNNYLVVVDNNEAYNRQAYKTAETTATAEEMGSAIPVVKKNGQSIGGINIKSRSFQNEYWNADVSPYQIGKAEKDFAYLTKNNKAGAISVFGIDGADITADKGQKGHLFDYYHRHAGLVSDSGIVYDLLGIKGNKLGGSGGSSGGGSSSKPPLLNTDDHYQYMIGYVDQTFRPDRNITREEVAAMFSRLLKDRPEKGKVYAYNFSDVNRDRWSITPVSYMSSINMVKGYPDGTFRPANSITRAEFAAMATRFAELTEGDAHFTDLSTNHWAYDAVARAATAGWISGYPDGSFKPNQPITRAEVIAITNRMLNRYADEAYVQKHGDDILYFSDNRKAHWAYYPIIEATNGHDYKRVKDAKEETWKEVNGKSFV